MENIVKPPFVDERDQRWQNTFPTLTGKIRL